MDGGNPPPCGFTVLPRPYEHDSGRDTYYDYNCGYGQRDHVSARRICRRLFLELLIIHAVVPTDVRELTGLIHGHVDLVTVLVSNGVPSAEREAVYGSGSYPVSGRLIGR